MTPEVLPRQAGRGLIICVSGPSGVGKGSIIARIRELCPAIAHSISVTTRQPRPDEVEGVSYYFRKPEEFLAMLENDEILEYDSYCQNYYGTPRTPLDILVNQGTDVIMDITVPGSLAVMAKYPEVITIFLMPPSFTELQRRLSKRGTDHPDAVAARMANAKHEIRQAEKFQYVVVNDDIDTTAKRILCIIEAERCRYSQMKGIEDQVLEL
ncbi:MAG: guanylate kinase [Ruminococcaceae bacterium]|nr:guanylate kinase [Oscillospiraceae bacterium]